MGARAWVYLSVRDRVHSVADVQESEVALVLGTQALPGGELSPRLASRCDKAIELYKAGKVKKLLMSGDNRAASNREPESMRAYAIKRGVRASDVTIDDAGMRTYDSVYRARHVFGQDSVIVVTQGFHLGRTLFLGRGVGLDAYGVGADLPGEPRDQVRECAACLLAICDCYLWKPRPSEEKENR